LVAQASRYLHFARNRGRKTQAYADEEFALEDGERLVLSELLQIRGRRPDDLFHRHTVRRVDLELGRNQVGITRLVRLGMESFGNGNLQADTNG
jgi:hypothetical protein